MKMRDNRASNKLEELKRLIPEGERGFIQLIPNGPKMEMATEQENEYCRAACKRFFAATNEIVGRGVDCPPYSALACIMSLPEIIKEDAYAQFEKWLNLLLSDQGFYFSDVRPLAQGQISLRNRTASMVVKDEIYLCNAGDETFIVSQITHAFEQACSADPEKREALNTMSGALRQTDIIGTLIRQAVDARTEIEKLPQFWLDINRKKFDLPMTGEDQIKKYKDILVDLQGVCRKFTEDRVRNKQLYISDQIFCEKALQRFQSMKSCGGGALIDITLKEFWRSDRLLLCSDPSLARKLIQRIREKMSMQYYKKNVAYDQAHEQSFLLSKYIQNNTTRVSKAKIGRVADELAKLYMQYFKCRDIERENIAKCMQMIVPFSISEDFLLTDIEQNRLPALAPVITYLFFQNYTDAIRKDQLTRIAYDQLFRPVSKWEDAVAISIFDCLCGNYAEYYNKKYSPQVQKEWYIAYSVLTDRKNRHRLWDEADKLDPAELRKNLLHPCYDRVPLLLRINQPSFLHDSVTHLWYSDKMLTSNNARNACAWIRSNIEGNEKFHEWLSTYCDLLNSLCSEDTMASFMEAVTKAVFWRSFKLKAVLYAGMPADEQIGIQYGVYEKVLVEFCEEYALKNEFKRIRAHVVCLILTECVLYKELAEQCAQRLDGWIDQLIRWHLKDIE